MSETYRVLARKYRPRNFDDLVGQEALVRTLSNAIRTGRIAHAFLLTGIRGVGKTTTARIIARALNCTGADGNGGPTANPCGECSNCVQIGQDRHVDVIEMDAASRTGVGDIRDLIETVPYAPAQGRYKIYIIDEVHMLSTSAFNALLKTLEEPPAHVIFIFATTELRKIPVTILSRCMCFDLRRLDTDSLRDHLKNICGKEQVSADDDALQLLAIAAEGSVRDSLSLLDQAIAHSAGEGNTLHIDTNTVRSMLGLADRTRVFALLETLLGGDIQQALVELRGQYASGADLGMVFQDLLQLIHLTMRLAIDPKADLGPGYAENEIALANKLAAASDVPSLSRAWQILGKGLDELRRAGDMLMTAEMVIIRLAYTSTLPTPADIAAMPDDASGSNPAPRAAVTASGGGFSGSGNSSYAASAPIGNGAPMAARHMEPVAQLAETPVAKAQHLTLAAHNPAIELHTLQDILELCDRQREPSLQYLLTHQVAVAEVAAGKVVLAESVHATSETMRKLAQLLERATDTEWSITTTRAPEVLTVAEQKKIIYQQELKDAANHPNVKAVLDLFPTATLLDVTDK